MRTVHGPQVLRGLGVGVLGLVLGGAAQASDPVAFEEYLAFGEGAELRKEVPTVTLLEDVCGGGEASKATKVIAAQPTAFDELKLICDGYLGSGDVTSVSESLDQLYNAQEAYDQIRANASPNERDKLKARGVAAPSFQANFTAALADFLVARTGAELSAWAMSNAAGRICKEPKYNATTLEYPIRTAELLPETCGLLKNLEDWGGSTAIQADILRDAVEGDMLTMARHLGAEIIRFASLNLEDGKNKSDSIDAGLVMAVVGRMVEQVVAGADPADAVASWAATREAKMPTWTQSADKDEDKNKSVNESMVRLSWTGQPLSSALYLISEIAYVGGLGEVGPLVATSDLSYNKVVPTYTSLNVGAALALATWHDKDALPDGLFKVGAKMSPESMNTLRSQYGAVWESSFLNLRAIAEAWTTRWNAAKIATKEERLALVAERVSWTADLVKDLANLAMSLSEIVSPTSDASGTQGKAPSEPLKQLATLSTLSAMSEVVEHIAAGDTAAGVHDLMVLVPEVLIASGVQDEPWFEPVQRTAGLGAALSAAETSADMQAAMTQAAGKVGGYQDKREGETVLAPRDRFYATLNGYVGVAGGMAFTRDWERQGYTAWPMAAIGPEVGMKLKRTNLSLQVPLLDVGNLAAARFKGAVDTKGVEIADVFTPGVQLGIGIPCTPLVAGVRGTWTPREIENPINVAATVSVDLALFP